jgi:hypothetical protein
LGQVANEKGEIIDVASGKIIGHDLMIRCTKMRKYASMRAYF